MLKRTPCLIFFISLLTITLCACQAPSKSRDEQITNENQTTDNQESSADEPSGYEEAYLEFLKDKKDSHRLFSLVFVDGDDIPELYLSGVTEATGDMIATFKNGAVEYLRLNRCDGGKYIEKSGNIINQNGHMGYYYDNVYKLDENGFSEVLSVRYTENYERAEGEEYTVRREYFISDVAVTEAEYNEAVSSAFDLSKAVRLSDNALSYDEIIQKLESDD